MAHPEAVSLVARQAVFARRLSFYLNSDTLFETVSQKVLDGYTLLAALRLDFFDLFSCKHILCLCKCDKVMSHLHMYFFGCLPSSVGKHLVQVLVPSLQHFYSKA